MFLRESWNLKEYFKINNKLIMYIYVLLLRSDKYYVGVAEDIGLRLWSHFKMGNKSGSAWTKKYPPISVLHCSECSSSPIEFKRIEKVCTLRLAKLKGFENVRGSAYCLSSDEYPKGWDKYLDGVQPANLDKMKPLTNKELKELMKGKYQLWLKKRREGIEKHKAI
ncbi:GIY-YIG nuclease family protein [Microbulbifer sp. VTAC004]|uniref:GIY-YIG nuclease family protein n=1 Tax=Microbulbifer sp. VTAC004 TaxID=3243386 RepID=UPI00403A605A